MKAHISPEKCKICGADTSDLDFMAMDAESKEAFHICVDCLRKENAQEKEDLVNRFKIYRAILRTTSMTKERIKAGYTGEVTNEQIELYEKIYQMMDGQEAILAPALGNDNGYTFFCLTDKEKDREVSYLMEQDLWCGCFIDQREEFDQFYDSGEYDRDVSFVLDFDLVERVELLNG